MSTGFESLIIFTYCMYYKYTNFNFKLYYFVIKKNLLYLTI